MSMVTMSSALSSSSEVVIRFSSSVCGAALGFFLAEDFLEAAVFFGGFLTDLRMGFRVDFLAALVADFFVAGVLAFFAGLKAWQSSG
jgi:hypothetical protein